MLTDHLGKQYAYAACSRLIAISDDGGHLLVGFVCDGLDRRTHANASAGGSPPPKS